MLVPQNVQHTVLFETEWTLSTYFHLGMFKPHVDSWSPSPWPCHVHHMHWGRYFTLLKSLGQEAVVYEEPCMFETLNISGLLINSTVLFPPFCLSHPRSISTITHKLSLGLICSSQVREEQQSWPQWHEFWIYKMFLLILHLNKHVYTSAPVGRCNNAAVSFLAS